jgi:hypothetical protein
VSFEHFGNRTTTLTRLGLIAIPGQHNLAQMISQHQTLSLQQKALERLSLFKLTFRGLQQPRCTPILRQPTQSNKVKPSLPSLRERSRDLSDLLNKLA